MKTVALTAAVMLLTVLLGGGDPRSQQLSTSVYPSEDEIYQALRSGEITWDQYLILQEIIAHGLDSTNQHLLDEIPNLTFFRTDTSSLITRLEHDQQTPFTSPSVSDHSARKLSGSVKHNYYYSLDQRSPSKYSSAVGFMIGQHFSADVKFRREVSGRERVISRAVTYRNSRGALRLVTVGNYSRRLGLGTIFGHRGKLLAYSDNLDTESLAYPDYGGSNGALILLSAQPWEISTAASINRDQEYRLVSAAGLLSRRGSRFQPGLVWGVNRLTNRLTGRSVADIKYGLTTRYRYGRSYVELEITMQSGVRSSPGALVAEASHRFQSAQIKYAGWIYSGNYVDLSGGSKAASMRHRDRLEQVNFEYSTRRTGQNGGLFKTIVMPTSATELASSVIYAAFNTDTTDIQWLTEITGKPGERLSVSLDYLSKTKKRLANDGKVNETVSRQTRLEAGYRDEKLYVRGHIAYNTRSAWRDYTSVFFNVTCNIESYGTVELWSNLARLDHNLGRIDSWYTYTKNSFHLSGNVQVAVKLSHTYARGARSAHQTTAMFDLRVQL